MKTRMSEMSLPSFLIDALLKSISAVKDGGGFEEDACGCINCAVRRNYMSNKGTRTGDQTTEFLNRSKIALHTNELLDNIHDVQHPKEGMKASDEFLKAAQFCEELGYPIKAATLKRYSEFLIEMEGFIERGKEEEKEKGAEAYAEYQKAHPKAGPDDDDEPNGEQGQEEVVIPRKQSVN